MKKMILALVLLGYAAFGGLGTKIDEIACEAGRTDSCVSAAASYLKEAERSDNLTPEIDLGKAAEFLGKACAGKHKASCLQLGMMYQEGKGAKQDMAHAAQLYKKSCDGIGGEWAACGLYAEYQIGIEEMQEAALYYEKACRLGDWARLGTTDEKVGDIVNHLCEASESLKSFRPKESAAQRLLRDAARP